MTGAPSHIDFRAGTQRVAENMPAAVQKATGRFLANRASVVDLYGQARWEELRQAGHDRRLHGLNHLDQYLVQLEAQVIAAGGHVHWATDAAAARRIVREIASQHQVKRVVKSKSMATEEIGLNEALQEDGIQVLETDLGEYIIQLAGVGPSHIIARAVHLTKEEIATLFQDKLGVAATPDPKELTEIARYKLREEFLRADMGVSGGNFLVAETGTLVLVTNEGNGRMCTTLPPVHVAVVGIDKVVPDWESLNVLLKLLARSATGQKISCYTSFITGPARSEAEQGPREFHLVLLDNGRSSILVDPLLRETLLCIRCGACLNVCPVYNNVGGYAYGWVYSGPIGAILSTQLLGTGVAGDLPFASTLCGACGEICPVKVPIPEILLKLRQQVVEGNRTTPTVTPPYLATAARATTMALSLPWLYELGSAALSKLQRPLRREDWLLSAPPPLNRWTDVRPLPAFRADFRHWWRDRTNPTPPDRLPLPGRGRSRRLLALGIFAAVAFWFWRRRRK